ncbi:cAMP-dependent protein kinase catalytic subunit alpha-like [Anoplophora glabripennis]|uniref:cAMP-dependent protein kinase catalytic subunit alpha-like n=1 Tax=Anoplophora glabripennis TaxID=217634 RepID=UPI0008752DD1|nr:cAMP-dependent protein kinase catalytic subunit alpha-like [Anoplophora glabripennis]
MEKLRKKDDIEQSAKIILSSANGAPGLTRNRYRSAYAEVLDKLKQEFLERYEKKSLSSGDGLDKYVPVKTLGKGSFGHVFLVKYKEGDVEAFYAMKVLDKRRMMKLEQVDHSLNEKKILESVRFPFIVSMKQCFKDNSYIYFIMPFINGGEMFTHLRRMKRFTEVLAKFYAAQVVLSLEFLHYCDILYRDLKPENILIDQKGYIKIADLGFCKIVKGRTWTLCGTPDYIAPEIILSKGYGKAIDWWSFGVLIFEMNAGYPPFIARDPIRVYEKIVSCQYKCPGAFSSDLQDLVKNLLQLDLSRRYGNLRNGVQDIKTHKWFRDTDWLAVYNCQIQPPFVPQIKSIGDVANFDESTEENKLRVSEHMWYKDEFESF